MVAAGSRSSTVQSHANANLAEDDQDNDKLSTNDLPACHKQLTANLAYLVGNPYGTCRVAMNSEAAIGFIDGDWARERMRQIGATNATVAAAVDRDNSQVSRILTGQRRVTISQVPAMARALNVSVRTLLAHAGLEIDDPWAGEPANEPGNTPGVPEIAMRDSGTDVTFTGIWRFPPDYLETGVRVRPDAARIVEVISDDNAPTLLSGDRVMIDTDDTRPSPPGLFAIHDGISVVFKRIELIPRSEPLSLRISSDNSLHMTYEAPLTETRIIGRARWVARRL